jgi:hypothetical protein
MHSVVYTIVWCMGEYGEYSMVCEYSIYNMVRVQCILTMHAVCEYSMCEYSMCEYSMCEYSMCEYSMCEYSMCEYSMCEYNTMHAVNHVMSVQ